MRKTLGWFSQLLDGSRAMLFVSAALLVLPGAAFAKGTKQASDGLTIKPGVLTIGIEIGYPPFEYYGDDGKTLLGFDIQMAEAMAAKLGLKTRYIDTAWDGIFAGVTVGKYDCIISAVTFTSAVSFTGERNAAYNFTKPYIGNAQALVLRKGSTVTARNPSELSGYGVAYQAETTTEFYMANFAAKGVRFTAYEYDKIINCFDELRLGRVDAVVCDSVAALAYLQPEDSPFELVWQGPAEETFAICLKRGNDALTQALDKALDELFTDGTMLDISQNVFSMDMVSNLPYRSLP